MITDSHSPSRPAPQSPRPGVSTNHSKAEVTGRPLRRRLAAASLFVPIVVGTRRSDADAHREALAAITIMGSGRLGPTASAVLGLFGTLVGGLALSRARSSADTTVIDRWGAIAALALGTISLVFGALFLATADGGPGTGNGVVGSAVALVVGPIAIALGGLAKARRRDVGAISRVQLASSAPDATRGRTGSAQDIHRGSG
jgi:hypothetical protein